MRILCIALYTYKTYITNAFSFSAHQNINNAASIHALISISPTSHNVASGARNQELQRRHLNPSPLWMGKPKSGSIVDSYQTVSVNCKKCRTKLFRYKKKNGTKSNLIKCYVERISEDCVDLVAQKQKTEESGVDHVDVNASTRTDWNCPNCDTRFGKDSMIHGRPAIKLVGGKTAMTKKWCMGVT